MATNEVTEMLPSAAPPPPSPPPPTISSTVEPQDTTENQSPITDAGEPNMGGDTDARRKQKRRSGNSVDLTYRYREPSDDELSWTEDEHGNRRRRKSRKKSGAGDDFKTGIMYACRKSEGKLTCRPAEGKKRRRRRRSGQSAQDEDDDIYSAGETESESEGSVNEKK